MNNIYCLVWNSFHRTWVVAGEFSRARKKMKTFCTIALIAGGVAPVGFAETTITVDPNNPYVDHFLPVVDSN